MTTLHVIAHSPFRDERLASCLRLLGAKTPCCCAAMPPMRCKAGSEPLRALQAAGLAQRLFALDEDLQPARSATTGQGRGLPGFVELSLHYDKVNSWL
jgi:tRNA 2-thiouridine synthesizing protein B